MLEPIATVVIAALVCIKLMKKIDPEQYKIYRAYVLVVVVIYIIFLVSEGTGTVN